MVWHPLLTFGNLDAAPPPVLVIDPFASVYHQVYIPKRPANKRRAAKEIKREIDAELQSIPVFNMDAALMLASAILDGKRASVAKIMANLEVAENILDKLQKAYVDDTEEAIIMMLLH